MGQLFRSVLVFFLFIGFLGVSLSSSTSVSASPAPTVTAVERYEPTDDGSTNYIDETDYDGEAFGPVAGGTRIIISGTDLNLVDTVKIGGDTLIASGSGDDVAHASLAAGEWSYQTLSTKIYAITPNRVDSNLWVGSQQVVVAAGGAESTDEVYWEYRPVFEAVNEKVIALGDLASRTQAQPVITTTGSAPYTVYGTDSRSSSAYSFFTDVFYDPTDNAEGAGWSREGTEVVPDDWNGTSWISGSSDYTVLYAGDADPTQNTDSEQLVLESDMWCRNHDNSAPAGVDPVTNGVQDGTTSAYCSVFGPEVYTEPFRATDQQALAFNWKAYGGADNYEIYAFLVAVDDSNDSAFADDDHTVLAYGRGDTDSGFKTQASDIPTTGLYRFRFVNGSFDKTGGHALGARMFIQRAVTVGLKNLITFSSPGDQVASGGTYSDITVTLTTASAGQAALAAAGTSSCSVSLVSYSAPTTTYTVSSSSAGTCILTASAGALGSYAPASDVTRSFNYRAAATTPSAPTITSITGGAGAVTVNFTPPTSNGGATITNYQYTIDGTNYIDLSPADASSPITIPGLTLGTTYNIKIKAVNSVGAGTASNQVQGTPSSAAPTSGGGSSGNDDDEEDSETVVELAAVNPRTPVTRTPASPTKQLPAKPSTSKAPLLTREEPSAPSRLFDFGSGLFEGTEGQAFPNDFMSTALRTPQQLSRESLTGFLPTAMASVEVFGAATGARFITTPGAETDAIIDSLVQSARSVSSDYFGIREVAVVEPPKTVPDLDSNVSDINFVFEAAGLPQPTILSAEFAAAYQNDSWLELSGEVFGYIPGSLVYLLVNSEPLVVGFAEVNQDGNATISGDVPASWLAAGEHRIRAVGVKEFDGIQVGSDGSVNVPDQVLEDIQQFDLGTHATVMVSAMNPAGGMQTAVRVVPLEPIAPWWTLWILLGVFAIVLAVRLAGVLPTFGQRLVGALSVVAASTPGLILGWTSTVTVVSVWSGVLAVLFSVLVLALPSLKRA